MTVANLLVAAALQGFPAPAATSIEFVLVFPQEIRVMAQLPSGRPSGSRPAPPAVLPVVHQGVRYEQERSEAGGGAFGGVLTAVDQASGRVLWRVTVYQVADERPQGLPPMGLFFRAMALEPGGAAIAIEDEAGRRFRVDLTTRAVTTTFDPGAGRRAAPPSGGKPTND